MKYPRAIGIIMLASVGGLMAMAGSSKSSDQSKEVPRMANPSGKSKSGATESITLGGGCFWCVEAVYQRLEGVISVVSGYAGGHVDNPSYEAVCSGSTGHAEVCQIEFDPSILTFEEVLEVFWGTHDPTTKDRQGNDVGTQYRSVIFYHDESQGKLARTYLKQLDDSGTWSNPIVTEVEVLAKFYRAEDYHQDYFNQNPDQGYCSFIIRPKLAKFKKQFSEKLKKGL